MVAPRPLLNGLPAVAGDVAAGLTQRPKRLPPWLFYDEQGSLLFEQITKLPEYYLTRCEHDILRTYAPEMLTCAGSNLVLIELGAGTATKTGTLIQALLRRQMLVPFYPVDVSASALQIAQRSLRAISERIKVYPVVSDYTRGLDGISHIAGRKLVLYLGSSIGNFEPEEAAAILARTRNGLNPGDALLLGTDLVKPAAKLLPAYEDAAGITARFNKNVLARINRELDGHFDLNAFRHVALWNRAKSRVEMHLQSTRNQVVAIDRLHMNVCFGAGERIHTENSYKYTPAMVRSVLQPAGFTLERTWKDPAGQFAMHLARNNKNE